MRLRRPAPPSSTVLTNDEVCLMVLITAEQEPNFDDPACNAVIYKARTLIEPGSRPGKVRVKGFDIVA